MIGLNGPPELDWSGPCCEPFRATVVEAKVWGVTKAEFDLAPLFFWGATGLLFFCQLGLAFFPVSELCSFALSEHFG